MSNPKNQNSLKLAKQFEITDQWACFCLEYFKDFNGKEAALRAQFAESNAKGQASKLLKDPRVSRCLQAIAAQIEETLLFDAEKVQRRVQDIAFAKLTDIIEWNDEGIVWAKSSEELPEHVQAAVKSLKLTKFYGKDGIHLSTTWHVELESKVKALELLAKILDMMKNTVTVVHETHEQRVERLRGRQPKKPQHLRIVKNG